MKISKILAIFCSYIVFIFGKILKIFVFFADLGFSYFSSFSCFLAVVLEWFLGVKSPMLLNPVNLFVSLFVCLCFRSRTTGCAICFVERPMRGVNWGSYVFRASASQGRLSYGVRCVTVVGSACVCCEIARRRGVRGVPGIGL